MNPIRTIHYIQNWVTFGNTDPDSSAILDVSSSSLGVLFPRLTSTERDAIVNPAKGLVIYNTTVNSLQTNNGTTTTPTWDGFGVSTNMYTADGILAANRTVTQGTNTLDFTGTGRTTFGGNVGLGTTSPARPLHIQGSNTVLRIDRDSNSAAIHLHRFPSGDFSTPLKGFSITVDAFGANNGTFTIGDYGQNLTGAAASRLSINNTGNVGIGTTTPAEKLDVVGNVKFSGALLPNNVAGTTGQVLTSAGAGVAPTWATPAASVSSNLYTADGTLAGNRTVTQGTNTLNFAGTGVTTFNAGNIGVGTTTPTSKLEVNGSSTNTVALNAGSGTSIDFSLSNLAYTTASAGAITLTNIKNGGTYTLSVQGTTAGTAAFSAAGFTFRSVNNGLTLANTHTLYTFVVMGTFVYVSMTTGI